MVMSALPQRMVSHPPTAQDLTTNLNNMAAKEMTTPPESMSRLQETDKTVLCLLRLSLRMETS